MATPTLVKVAPSMTPDKIAGKLFYMHSAAHFYHLQCTSFSQHEMLKELYEALEDDKDSICEYLLGIQAPKRFAALPMDSITPFSDEVLTGFLQQGFDFSVQLCAYAEINKWEELCNLASELQGHFVKSQYLNTLK